MERQTLTVEQLNNYIRDFLANAPLLASVAVRGELSNIRTYGGSGHIYFTLKDEKSIIPATMFGGVNKLAYTPENGMKVICTGRVGVFVRDGKYQLYVDTMEPDGVGALAVAFEQLKEKLRAEGLFDEAHKKKLPKTPFTIGIITAPGGAAVRDMINVAGRRFPVAKLLLYPSLVQGPNAPAQLIKALKTLDASKKCDVIIIGRGGGSAEDLWCFNDEKLAHAVYECETPIISAVGHETDFTICDFVADMRAPTPSAAAELAVPDSATLVRQLGNVETRMATLLSQRLKLCRQQLASMSTRPVLVSPKAYFDERRMSVGRLEEKLVSLTDNAVRHEKMRLGAQSGKLMSLDPLSILSRGFSVAFDENGRIIGSRNDLAPGKEFELLLRDGRIKAEAK